MKKKTVLMASVLLTLIAIAFASLDVKPARVPEKLKASLHVAVPTLPNVLAPSSDLSLTPEEKAIMQKIRAFFVAGDYGRSFNLLEQSLREPGHNPVFLAWLNNQRDPVLTALGWLKLKTGQCEEAIELFTRAEGIRPSQEATKGLAFCYNHRHDFEAAEDKIRWLLTHQKEVDPDVFEIYAELLESKGRYTEAANALARLEKSGDKNTAQKIQALRKKAKRADRLQSIGTKFFLLTFEVGSRDLAEKTLALLEQALEELIEDFSLREPRRAIEILLDPPDHFGELNPDSPQWAEALYDGRIHVPAKASPDLQRLNKVLKHELVHALFAQMTGFRPLPSWFEEGIAQFVSECQNNCYPFSFFHSAESFLSVNVLNTPFHKFGTIQAEEAYRQSLYLILTLHEWKGREGLRSIIESIKIDSSPDSNALLIPVELSFRELVGRAEKLWKKRHMIRL